MSTLKVEKIQHPNSASVALTLDTSGYLALQAGSASTPAIQGPSDPNTGIFFPAADTIAFAEGGTEVLRIDSSGRVGIGTSGAATLLHVSGTGSQEVRLTTNTSGDARFGFDLNGAYYNWIENYRSSGKMSFATANTVALTIDSSQRVGVGTTTPFLAGSRNGMTLRANSSNGVELLLQSTSATDGTFVGYAIAASGNDVYYVNRLDGFHSWITGSAGVIERMRLDASGRLLVGTTSGTGDIMLHVVKGGTVNTRVESSSFANTNVCSHGALAGGRLAEIGVYKHSGITNSGAFLRLDQENGSVPFLWVDNSGNLRIGNDVNLVGTNSGTVVGTQTSDERLKNILGPVEYGLDVLKQIEPVCYALKTEPTVEKLGFIAQQVQPLIPQAIFDTNEHIEGEPADAPTKLGMEYVALIPVLVNAVKELSAEVDSLKTQLQAL